MANGGDKPKYEGGLVSALFDIRQLDPQTESEFARKDAAQRFLQWYRKNDPDALAAAEEQYKKDYPSLGRKIINKVMGKQYGGEIKRYAQPRKVNSK